MKTKFLTNLAVALALTVSAAAVTAPRAHAGLILAGLEGASYDFNADAGGAVLCLLLLPFCLLDQKTSIGSVASTTDLLANGYPADQVNQILTDQTTLMTRLHSEDKALQVTQTDTKASIEKDIRAIDPQVSETYLNFVTGSLSLK